jgi:hypothetical protein
LLFCLRSHGNCSASGKKDTKYYDDVMEFYNIFHERCICWAILASEITGPLSIPSLAAAGRSSVGRTTSLVQTTIAKRTVGSGMSRARRTMAPLPQKQERFRRCLKELNCQSLSANIPQGCDVDVLQSQWRKRPQHGLSLRELRASIGGTNFVFSNF